MGIFKDDIWGYPFRPLNQGGINPAKAQAWRSEESVLEYTSKDTILYALGIGAGPNKDPCELKYIYENHEDFMVSLNKRTFGSPPGYFRSISGLLPASNKNTLRLSRHSPSFQHLLPLGLEKLLALK